MLKAHRLAAHGVAGVATVAMIGFALAQAPIPIEEQIRLFNSMAPAQQQALIRELQKNLPPAQLQAVLRVLQRNGDAASKTEPEVEPVPATRAPEGAPNED